MTPPPSQPNISKRDHSLSPQKPKKRARGGARGRGGRGSRRGQGVGRHLNSVIKGEDSAKEKEEIEIIEDDEVFVNTRWTDDDRSILFEYYLGPESDEVFEKLKINAKIAHKKVSNLNSMYSNDNSLF